jgi:hypothetical protein
MLSIKLFWLVFCLFRFNRNTETLCFGIGAKQPKQNCFKTNHNKPKQTEKTKTTLIFLKKYKDMLSIKLSRLTSVCFGSMATLKLSVSV